MTEFDGKSDCRPGMVQEEDVHAAELANSIVEQPLHAIWVEEVGGDAHRDAAVRRCDFRRGRITAFLARRADGDAGALARKPFRRGAA